MKLSQGLACLEFQIMSSYINTECTNPDLSMKDAIDGVTISNCGFKFQNAIHTDIVKQYEVWPDNLVQQ